MLIGFGDIGRHFSKTCTETFKKDVHNPKHDKDHVSKKWRTVFLNNWYSISQILLKPIIERSFRQPAQPKRDSAFEQKTRIVSSKDLKKFSKEIF